MSTQLPFLPQKLPQTQAEWQQALNILQQWQQQLNANSASLAATSAQLGPNSYEISINGVIHQWGIVLVTNGTPAPVTFPLPFPNFCRSLIVSLYSPATSTNTAYGLSLTLTGFSANVGGGAGQSDVYWHAIGN